MHYKDELTELVKEALKEGIPALVKEYGDEDITVISIDADSGPWKGKSQRLLLIGMDEDGRAVVADVIDRKWFETDQRIKLTDIDELISFIDDGYIVITAVE